jgi:diadenosine tetraphosphatase ApaH/serine/threonine PP2A family protein phosphatase
MTMRQAVLSDIHGNWPAFRAVLDHLSHLAEPVERIICLGDVIGYGPDPIKCLQAVSEHCSVCLMGNHEWAVLHGAEGFNPVAAKATQWTRHRLQGTPWLKWVKGLRHSWQERGVLYLHASVKDPLMDYVREPDSPEAFWEARDTLREEFTDFDLCFTGHNHRAFLVTEEGFLYPHEEFRRFRVKEAKLYVCVGSVGQPRDGNADASFVIHDGESVEFVRVPYDIELAAARVREVGLPEVLGDRLFRGR